MTRLEEARAKYGRLLGHGYDYVDDRVLADKYEEFQRRAREVEVARREYEYEKERERQLQGARELAEAQRVRETPEEIEAHAARLKAAVKEAIIEALREIAPVSVPVSELAPMCAASGCSNRSKPPSRLCDGHYGKPE